MRKKLQETKYRKCEGHSSLMLHIVPYDVYPLMSYLGWSSEFRVHLPVHAILHRKLTGVKILVSF